MPARSMAGEIPTLPLTGPTFLLLTAAGTSSRFGSRKKELMELGGESVLLRALRPFLSLPDLAGIVLTYPDGGEKAIRGTIPEVLLRETLAKLPLGIAFQKGGPTRQDSVREGLRGLLRMAESGGIDAAGSLVLVHDGARPWASEALARGVAGAARKFGAAVPLLQLTDTPKLLGRDGLVAGHPGRDSIALVQTPQGFSLLALARAHERALEEKWSCTDDSSVWDRYLGPVAAVDGERENKKVTYREDLDQPQQKPFSGGRPPSISYRLGEGWDIHPLVPNRPLLVGGYRVESPVGESGHSDGDVLWHAVIDALFGAARLGDIGSHYPPSDEKWRGADSSALARDAIRLVREAGLEISNIDCTIVLERPKLGSLKDDIAEKMASVLGVGASQISVKAKTHEGMDSVGRGEAIEARAVVLLTSNLRS